MYAEEVTKSITVEKNAREQRISFYHRKKYHEKPTVLYFALKTFDGQRPNIVVPLGESFCLRKGQRIQTIRHEGMWPLYTVINSFAVE